MKDKGPRKKPSGKRDDPESIEGKRPGENTAPGAPERTDEPATTGNAAPATAYTKTRREPVTNQDEQDKITNAESSDLPVADN